MTISSTVRIAGPFIGTGTATVFPYAFKIFAASNLQVVRADSSTGLESTLILNTDYTVSLNTDQDSNPGGNVTLLAVLAVGFTMVITSDIANLQPTDLTNQGGFYPEVITDALDRATIQIQQMADELTRSIKIPISDGLSLDMELPTAAARANSFLAFDATGEPTVVTAGSSGAPTTITRQQFSGTGAQVAFTLASDPGALGNSCEVFINGIYQQRDTYTIAGTTLTFTAAPVAGTDNIEIVNFLTSAIGTTDSSLVTFVPAGTGATMRTVDAKLKENLHISDFGGAAGASAITNTTALTNAIAQAVVLGKSGVNIGPGGTWALTAGTNWANRDISIIGIGKPTLDFSAGTGIGFKLDAGGTGAVIRGMTIENFIIKGGPLITDIFYSRGIVASQFKNLEVREGTATGFSILFAVLNTYTDCRVSNDSLAMTTTPSYYFKLDNNGTAGYRTQANTFINCDASGIGASSTSEGWRLVDATLNVWMGGTAESLSKGINIVDNQCRLNTWIGFDLEDNQVNDIDLRGTGNVFDNCVSQSTSSGAGISITTGKGTVFKGGYIRWVNLGASSSNTSFLACGIDENLSGTIGIQGSGTYTSIGLTKIDNNGLVVGTLPDRFGIIGNGIQFPAIQVQSADVNNLDDYQEGTWIPTLITTGGTITLDNTFTAGSYTKIGRLVTVNAYVLVTSVSLPTGDLTVNGLPFAVANGNGFRSAATIYANGLEVTATTSIMGFVLPTEQKIYIRKFAAGANTNMAADVKASSSFQISLTYMTTD